MAISEDESVKRVKLDLKRLSNSEKDRAKEIAGRIILSGIDEYLDSSRSPVKGGAFEPIKATDGTASQLFERGSMRSNIEFEVLDIDAIDVGIFKDAPKQDRLKSLGHNSGFKGHPNESKMRKYKREFIPAPNKVFQKEITDRVDNAIQAIRDVSVLNDDIINQLLDDSIIDELE